MNILYVVIAIKIKFNFDTNLINIVILTTIMHRINRILDVI